MKVASLKARIGMLTVATLIGIASASAESATATGQVRKVDVDSSKITIKHGPIRALDMPEPMTMVYRVKDPSLLKSVKAGDSVEFDIDHGTSGYVITRMIKK